MEDSIYRHMAVGYSVHQRIRLDFDKTSENFHETIPPDSVPIDIRETQFTWILPCPLGVQDIILDPDPNASPTIEDTISLMHPWEKALLHNTVLIQPEVAIWTALCHNQCFMASDGSAPKDHGLFAWILSNANGVRLARCQGPVFGHAISSY